MTRLADRRDAPVVRMLSIKDAARYCGVSAYRMRVLARTGTVPTLRPTDSPTAAYIFDSRDLDAWIASRMRISVVTPPTIPDHAGPVVYGGRRRVLGEAG